MSMNQVLPMFPIAPDGSQAEIISVNFVTLSSPCNPNFKLGSITHRGNKFEHSLAQLEN